MSSPTFGNYKKDKSVWSLILVNMIPIAGVLFWDWDVFHIFIIYVIETFFIGFFNILKFFAYRGKDGTLGAKFFMIPFFCVHYFGFAIGQSVFMLIGVLPTGGNHQAFHSKEELLFALGSMFLNHGYSFWINYMGKEEYLKGSMTGLMFKPYKRIVIQQLLIVLGATLFLDADSPIYILIFFVFLKTVFDLIGHLLSHAFGK